MFNVYTQIPKSEIEHRVQKLKEQLKNEHIDGALLFSTQELYYYSGMGIDGAIFIPIDEEPIHLVKRNLHLAEMLSHFKSRDFGRQSKLIETLNLKGLDRIAIEKDILSCSFVEFMQSKAKNIELINGTSIFREIRSIKSKYEIDQIEKAAELVDQSFYYCTEIANPEMTEIELASSLDSWLLQNGHDGHISTRAFNSELLHYSYVISSGSSTLNTHFTPISGKGLSLKYPYGPARQKLGKNRPFFIDSCGNKLGYISDTTRSFICGHFDNETRDQLDALCQIKEYLRAKLKPNISLSKLYYEIMELSMELKIHEHFMGTESDRVAFIGHGVGLELDELPIFYRKGSILVSGNVLACEPKFFIQEQKVLGIEDTFTITDSSNRLLSKSPNFFEI